MDANMHLITIADLFIGQSSLTESTIAKHAAGQAHFFRGMRAGAGITVGRYNRVLQYFSDHWPLDLMWPADIPRPEPTKEVA